MLRNKKTVYAGRMVSQVIYPVATGLMTPRERAGKMKATSAAQAKLNFKHSWEKLSAVLAANFTHGDDVVCLTYDDAHYPKDRKRVMADLKAFRDLARKEWKRRGLELRMVWCIEHRHGEGRWHAHAVINRATGNDGPLLLSLWGRGGVHIKHLREDREKNHLALAKYMAKESEDRENSRRAWSYTRSCRKPEVVTERNVGDEALQLPKGAMLLEQESHRNEFGLWQYIRYYVPDDAPERTQKMARILL